MYYKTVVWKFNNPMTSNLIPTLDNMITEQLHSTGNEQLEYFISTDIQDNVHWLSAVRIATQAV